MRFITILAALVILGLLLKTQLNSDSSVKRVDALLEAENIKTLKVPSTPNELKDFEKNVNDFVLESSDKRAQKLEESLGN